MQLYSERLARLGRDAGICINENLWKRDALVAYSSFSCPVNDLYSQHWLNNPESGLSALSQTPVSARRCRDGFRQDELVHSYSTA